jgi:hypothetical protein
MMTSALRHRGRESSNGGSAQGSSAGPIPTGGPTHTDSAVVIGCRYGQGAGVECYRSAGA